MPTGSLRMLPGDRSDEPVLRLVRAIKKVDREPIALREQLREMVVE